MFDPGPIEHPDIPIHVAAIGPNMCAVAGEVADGVRLHPICTTRFIDESVKPAVERGAAAAGRDLSEIEFCMKPLVATAPDEASLARVKRDRPGARRVLPVDSGVPPRVRPSRDGASKPTGRRRCRRRTVGTNCRRSSTTRCSTTVATVGTHATIADQLRERYRTRVDRIEFSIPVVATGDGDTLRHLLARDPCRLTVTIAVI